MSNGFRLSSFDEAILSKVDPHLAAVVRQAAVNGPNAFKVVSGRRTVEEQRRLVAEHRSLTMHSKHLTGEAVDLAALVNGAISWNADLYGPLNDQIQEAARQVGVTLTWGGSWHSIHDLDHWQLG